jgi:predicted nucleic acid-binding protein
VIAYVDSSVLVRAYLDDEAGSTAAQDLLADRSVAKYTGRWTRIEVSAAIVRAARGGRRVPVERKLAALDTDLRRDVGRVKVISAPAEEVEAVALDIARSHGLRALDALHVALASLVLPSLADRGEPLAFASRDGNQATVAESLGFACI